VVLASGATAGDIVTVESFRVESVLNAISNSAGSVGTTNIADNAITTAKIAAGAVVPADLSTGGPSWDTSGNLTITGTGTVIQSITSTSGTGKKWDLMSHTDGRFLIRQGTAVFAPMEIDPTTYTVGFNGSSPAINLAGGIQFPATQVASANANTLDDYEEGTWTPVVRLGSTVNTSSGVAATYTKIGRVVYIQATIATITKSGTGDLSVGGLPFTVGASSLGDIQATVRWEAITSSGLIYGYFSAGNTNISMQNFGSSGYTGSINNTNCSATYTLYGIQGFYFVS
jgi:hypothetical protein